MKKIYIVGNDWNNITCFINFPFTLTDNVNEADIAIFTGGADINPEIYGDTEHPSTYFDRRRDAFELAEYNKIPAGTLKLGICRGAQLLCALSGGKLIQDVRRHAGGGGHTIQTNTGEIYNVTSVHHQMMYPWNMPKENWELLAWSEEARSDRYCMGNGPIEVPNAFVEVENAFFPKTNSLCIQGHPEWSSDEANIEYTNQLILSYLK